LSRAVHRVFVYGTLKQGFRNFSVNRGTRVPGEFVTVDALPLHVIGEFGLPWLVYQPGAGHRVTGQWFEVDHAGLAAMDALERVSEPGWYTRRALEVAAAAGGAPIDAVAYFGDAVRLTDWPIHAGPIERYTVQHQLLYRRHV
jgi:gamma-glutamylaminecyclotransferase